MRPDRRLPLWAQKVSNVIRWINLGDAIETIAGGGRTQRYCLVEILMRYLLGGGWYGILVCAPGTRSFIIV